MRGGALICSGSSSSSDCVSERGGPCRAGQGNPPGRENEPEIVCHPPVAKQKQSAYMSLHLDMSMHVRL